MKGDFTYETETYYLARSGTHSCGDKGRLRRLFCCEYYDINAEDEGTWELVNGDELYFRDSDGEGYSSEMAMERVRELEAMIAGAEEDQDTSRWEKDIELLTTRCEVIEPCEYYQVPEEGARILLDESEELVYYNARLEVYVWGICHLGLNWKRVLTTIPVR